MNCAAAAVTEATAADVMIVTSTKRPQG
jgi:hypothetical protein